MQNFTGDITSLFTAFLLSVIGIIAGIAGLYFLGYFLLIWYRNRDREKTSLESVLLQIALPRDNDIKIGTAEQLFASIASIGKGGLFKNPPHLTFEIVGMPGDIRFYVHTPGKLRDLVEKQINGAYPDAEIKVVSSEIIKKEGMVVGNDYNIFSNEGRVAFASLKLKASNYKPIKVYKDLPVDPLSSITSVLAKMTDGEGAAIQVLITPADSSWKKAGRDFLSKTKKAEANPETAKYSADSKELEGIENKIGKPGFNVVVRIVVSSTSKEVAEAHLGNITSAYSQFDGANSFTKNKIHSKGSFLKDFIYRYLPMTGSPYVLTSEELATIFHFPNKSITTPNIFWMNAKRAPAPAQIPTSGLYLGKSTYRGLAKPVYMDLDDRRRHMYIIGKTGTGKSEFLKDMIMQDIRGGKGIAVIDPHGDLIDDILPMIPAKRAEDVILFDPSDTERPMGFNMLEADTEEQKHYVVSSIIGLMYKLFDPNKTGIIGPRFEHAIRNAMLTVMYE